MNAIRRVYQYLLALAGLTLLAVSLASLGWVLVAVLLPAVGDRPDFAREEVARWGAGAVVGLVVWLVHWVWAERLAARSADERGSGIRRLYLYASLAGAAVAGVAALAEIARDLVVLIGPAAGRPSGREIAERLPALLVAAGVWAFQWRIAQRDRRLVGEVGASGTLRRWYVYGATFYGFLALLVSAQAVLEWLWLGLLEPGAAQGVGGLADAVAGAVVGLLLWLVHLRLAVRMVGDDPRERRATLRAVYLFLGLAAAVVGTLVGSSQLLYYALGRALGVAEPGGVGGNLLTAAASPVSLALVFGGAWAYQRLAVRRAAAEADVAPRQVGVRRVYTYLVALVALVALAVGLVGLLWTLADTLVPGELPVDVAYLRDRLALFATLVIVALPVWVGHWRPAPGADEERAFTRRLYGYLALIGGALALLGAAATALYQVLGVALGVEATPSRQSDLLHALAVGVVAAVVVGYHARVVRRTGPALVEAAPPATVAPAAERVVRLRAADAAALEAALASLRASGLEVDRVD